MENLTPGPLPKGYEAFLRDLKQRIRSAQVRAAAAVNRELILLYWRIGRDVLDRQAREVGAQESSSAWLRICTASSRT
jgi:hypothetical protein